MSHILESVIRGRDICLQFATSGNGSRKRTHRRSQAARPVHT